MSTEKNISNKSTQQIQSSVSVLDVGSGSGSTAKRVLEWLETDVTRLDIDPNVNPDILFDISKPIPDEMKGKYDIVFLSHVLGSIDRYKVIPTFRNIIGAVKNHGEVWILTPSLEWAAGEIVNRREGLGTQATIYGEQNGLYDANKCGFTLAGIRQMVEISGLIIRKAYQSPYHVTIDGDSYGSIQNIVIAARVDEINNPAEAISENP